MRSVPRFLLGSSGRIDPWVVGLLFTIGAAVVRAATPRVAATLFTVSLLIIGTLYVFSSNVVSVVGDQPSGWLGAGDSLLMTDVLPHEFTAVSPPALVKRVLSELGPLCSTGPAGGDANPPAAVVTKDDADLGFPLYRYPAQPLRALYEGRKKWSMLPSLSAVRDVAVRCAMNQMESGVADVPNSCVVNYYEDGDVELGPHKDKTLDLEPGSPILIVSLGAPRVLVLKETASSTDTAAEHRITLRHGSLFILGPLTNKTWTHAIPAGPPPKDSVKSAARISLTMRSVSTHARALDPSSGEPVGLTGRGKGFSTVEWPGEAARNW